MQGISVNDPHVRAMGEVMIQTSLRRWINLRNRVFAATRILAVMLVCVFVILPTKISGQTGQLGVHVGLDVRDDLNTIVESSVHFLNITLAKLYESGETLSRLPEFSLALGLAPGSPEYAEATKAITQQIRAMNLPIWFSHVAMLPANGDLRFFPVHEIGIDVNMHGYVSWRNTFMDERRGGTFLHGPFTRSDGQQFLHYSQEIIALNGEGAGISRGYLVVFLSLSRLSEFFKNELGQFTNITFSILNSDGDLLISFGQDPLTKASRGLPFVQTMLTDRQGVLEYRWKDGKTLACYNTVDGSGWLVTAAARQGSPTLPQVKTGGIILMLAGFGVLFGGLLARSIARK